MASAPLKALATSFRSSHKPGDPLILSNVWDCITAKSVTKVQGVKAIATASYSIAASLGLEDNELSLEKNLAVVRNIGFVASKSSLPLTVDLQDGYEDISSSIAAVIKIGAVGCNIEDMDNQTGTLRSKEDATNRISAAFMAAKEAGLSEFVINARTDVMGHGGSIDDVIDRAKAYLDAGACTAFVWGGGGPDLTASELGKAVKALDGRVSVLMRLKPGSLTTSELKRLGVARISVGPAIQFKVAEAFESAVLAMLQN
jgi:2-methylisocitrate lyase-like PEP mutase family enzyme